MMHDGTTRVSLKGQPLFISARLGTWAEQVVCPAEQAIRSQAIFLRRWPRSSAVASPPACVPSPMPPAWKPGTPWRSSAGGGVGLSVIQGARLVGASTIIAIDILDGKLEYAQEFGATHKINGSREEVAKRVHEITGGGVDYVFEAIGLGPTVEQALDCARVGGTVVVVGMAPMDHRATIDPLRFVRR